MISLYEFVDFIKVIQIKMLALYAEVPFNRFGKELRFVGVDLGDFVVVAQSWVILLTLWLKKVLGFSPGLAWICLLANRVAEFSPNSLRFFLKFFFNLFLQLVNARFYSRVFILRVLSPKPMFLLN